MPPIRVTAGTKAAPAPKLKAPPKVKVPTITAPVRGPKTVSNYAPSGKSDTAAPTATRGPRTVTNYAPAPKLKQPVSHGTSWLSVITNPASITSGLDHALSGIAHTTGRIAVDAGKDLYSLPGATIEGIQTVGAAAVEDFMNALEHGHGGMVGGPTDSGGFFTDTHLGQLADQAWKTSVVDDIAHGDISAAAHKFVSHPVYTALNFAGGAGVLGRLAGATARTGALGAKAADVASLARADRAIAPGIPGEVRHYSPNLLKKGVQVAAEQVHVPDALAHRLAEHRINRRTDDLVGVNQAIHRLHEAQLVKQTADVLRDGKRLRTPKGRQLANDVAPFVAQGMASGKGLLDELKAARDEIQSHVDAGTVGDRAATEAAHAHVANIDAFLAHPDVRAAEEIAAAYVTRQHEFDPELQRLGLLESEQARVAPLEPAVAAGHVPGVRMADQGGEVSVRSALLREARRSVKYLDRQLQDTKLDNVKLTGRSELDSALRDAKTKLTQAQKAEQRTYGVLRGRHGGDTPLPPKVAARMHRYLDRTVDAQHAFDQARVALRSGQAERKAMAGERLAAALDALNDAKAESRKLDKYEKERLSGVVADTDVRLKGGKYAVRRVTADELEQRMRAAGRNPEDIAYLNLKAPQERAGGQSYLSSSLSRGDTPSRSRTAAGVTRGAFNPGGAALINSQLGTLGRIDRAQGFDEFIAQQAVHGEDGQVAAFDKYHVHQAAHDYEAEHGIAMTPVPLHSAAKGVEAQAKIRELQSLIEDGQDTAQAINKSSHDARFGLVPTTAVDRYLKHLEVDRKSGHGPLSTITRSFRNTVLPFSPRWFAGNVIEATLRSALVGAGPRDAQIVGKVLERLRAEGHHYAADRLEALMGGLHYGMAHSANERAIGAGALSKAGPLDSVPGIHIARELGDAYMRGIVQPVFAFNRRIEQGFEHAVMGAHMHRQMREFGATWLQAAQHEQEWINRLAEGYTDPALALDAGRYIHEVLGQYDRFSPAMKNYVNRFAPFAPWYFNAARFVYLTMPLKHPLTEATLQAAAQTAAQEYANRDVPHDSFFGLPVGSLLTELKVGPDAYVDTARYTPFGAFENGPWDFFGSQIFPQGQGPALAAFGGEDPFGRALKMPSGDVTDIGDRLAVAANELFLSLAGPLDVLHRIIGAHGSTEYSGSTLWQTRLKPDTHHGAPGALGGVERTLLPGFPTYLAKNAAGAGPSIGSGKAPSLGSGKVPSLGSGKIPSLGG